MAASIATQVDRRTALSDNLLAALLKALLGLWGGFKGWEDENLVHGNIARSVSLVDQAVQKQRLISRSYGNAIMQTLGIRGGPRVSTDGLYVRSGTSMQDAYTRPYLQYRYAISQSLASDVAEKRALQRLEDLVTMDLRRAELDELEAMWSTSPDTIGYRRIIRPYLSAGGTCGLCIVAADRFYSYEELAALHEHCKCTVLPVTKTDDPGLKLNRDQLNDLYAAAGSTAAEDLKRVRITVRENGELGPILVRDGQKFRDVDEVGRNARGKEYTPYSKPNRDSQRSQWEAMKASSLRAIAKLQDAQSAGNDTVDIGDTGRDTKVRDYAQAIQFHKDLIARMDSKLR